MTTKTAIKPKIDTTPAPLKSLAEIDAEVGMPFTAMSLYSGISTITKLIAEGADGDLCRSCGGIFNTKEGKYAYYYSPTQVCVDEWDEHIYGFNTDTKNWVLLT